MTAPPAPADLGNVHSLKALSDPEAQALRGLAASTTGPVRPVQRARALLALSGGAAVAEAAQKVGCTPRTAARWRSRFADEGVTAVFDAPRSGAPPRLDAKQVLTICEVAVTEPQSLGVPLQCWSGRRLCQYLRTERNIQVGHERLRQILIAHKLNRKAEVSAQRSPDPHFADKRDAVIDLYMHPPENSVVACVDQKGPISLHASQGHRYTAAGDQPHYDREYKRHGTTYALGAFVPHTGEALARSYPKYNAATFICFLAWLLPQLLLSGRDLYLILDNASAHTALKVTTWLLQQEWHARVHFVFTPSKSAWLNLIEAFWRILDDELLQGSDFHNAAEFAAALEQYLTFYNRHCHPFIWGRKRKVRLLLSRPMRQRLRGRAGARSIPAHLLRAFARAA